MLHYRSCGGGNPLDWIMLASLDHYDLYREVDEPSNGVDGKLREEIERHVAPHLPLRESLKCPWLQTYSGDASRNMECGYFQSRL